ncbi:MAG: dephospho-CoA kinase [Bacteriovoracaceae bacterium]
MFTILKPEQRLYHVDRPILALTGGIGSGKTTVASMLEKNGFPVISADLLVKKIYAKKSSIEFVQHHFPPCVQNEKINFMELRKVFFSDEKNKVLVEGFIYPQLEHAFLDELNGFSEKRFVLYDVPLLFERKLEPLVDFVILAYTDLETRIKRIMARDSVDRDLAIKIIEAQMSLEDKIKKSHYIVDNSLGLPELVSSTSLLSSKLLAFLSKE